MTIHVKQAKRGRSSPAIVGVVIVAAIVTLGSLAARTVAAQDQGDAHRLAPTAVEPVRTRVEGSEEGDLENNSSSSATEDGNTIDDLLNQDLETLANTDVVVPLMQTEVTTVSRTESSVGKSPAPIFVVTNEMIRRSGARSLPDALRLVPGVQVARTQSGRWSITIRGFNNAFANKLLVQIDGRSVYTPLFAGVYWDVQDVVLEDVDRIEVIRGPGGTVWGANAVNGVINVITKHASDTQGLFAEVGGGSEERGFTTARYGTRIGENAHARVYGKWFDRDAGFGPVEVDDWHQGRGGFRIDWAASECDSITFQGDIYEGKTGQFNQYPIPTPPFATLTTADRVAGGNALLNWNHQLDGDQDWTLRMYYDNTQRGSNILRENRDTFDIDWQFHWHPWEQHRFVGGLGYRFSQDHMRNSFGVSFDPSARAIDLFSYFLQDQVTLSDELWFLTFGSKFEHNDFTAFEFQPSVSLLYTPSPRLSAWASVSRAVRTPARVNDDLQVFTGPFFTPAPAVGAVFGNPSIESEDLLAFQAGVRQQPTDRFFWDATAFLNRYEDLIGVVPQAPFFQNPFLVFPQTFSNDQTADSYGFELTANYQFTPEWRLSGAYSFIRINAEPDAAATVIEGAAPRNQFSVLSLYDFGGGWHCDAALRYVDVLPAVNVPSYFVMDARLAYRPDDQLEIAVAGRNFLDSSHLEWIDSSLPSTEVQQEVYGIITYRY